MQLLKLHTGYSAVHQEAVTQDDKEQGQQASVLRTYISAIC